MKVLERVEEYGMGEEHEKAEREKILIKLNCTHKQKNIYELEECFMAYSMLLERELKLNEKHGILEY